MEESESASTVGSRESESEIEVTRWVLRASLAVVDVVEERRVRGVGVHQEKVGAKRSKAVARGLSELYRQLMRLEVCDDGREVGVFSLVLSNTCKLLGVVCRGSTGAERDVGTGEGGRVSMIGRLVHCVFFSRRHRCICVRCSRHS
jgi:hypothetical protein